MNDFLLPLLISKHDGYYQQLIHNIPNALCLSYVIIHSSATITRAANESGLPGICSALPVRYLEAIWKLFQGDNVDKDDIGRHLCGHTLGQ